MKHSIFIRKKSAARLKGAIIAIGVMEQKMVLFRPRRNRTKLL